MASTLKPQNKQGSIQTWALVVVSAVFIVSGILLVSFVLAPQSQYSDAPLDWIDQEIGMSTIDVEEVSDGHGTYDYGKQRISLGFDTIAGLSVWGSYQGEVFQDALYDQNSRPLMRLSPNDIDPNNGIPEGFAVAKLDTFLDKAITADGPPRPTVEAVYLYVDEDWKQQAGNNLNIVWGLDINNPEGFEQRAFNFNNVEEGLYFDHIETNIDWVLQPGGEQQSRVIVGSFTKDDLLNERYSMPLMILT